MNYYKTKPRLIVSLVVSSGYVYQSYNYSRLLPVGRLSVVLERLVDYQVDECIIKLLHDDDDNTLSELSNVNFNLPLGIVGSSLKSSRIEDYMNVGIDRLGFEIEWIEPHQRSKVKEWSEKLGKQSCFIHLPYNANDSSKKSLLRKWDLIEAINFIKKTNPPVGEVMFWNIAQESDYYDMENIPVQLLTDLNYNICFGGGKLKWSGKYFSKLNGLIIGNIIHRRELEYQRVKNSLKVFQRNEEYEDTRKI